MFESIKGALVSEKENKSNNFNDILKTEPENTYTVRLLPYEADPSKTMFHFYQHGWESFATGQYVSALSLQTFGERDPIAEERYKILRTGSEEEQEKAKAIYRAEKWLINVYVVNDPVNPDNNGTVKILRFGKQLYKIISDAISGEDEEELGSRIFDLSSNGVNFKIKVEKQGDFPTYVSSKFSMPCSLEGVDDEDDQKEILDQCFDLTQVIPTKTYQELKEMFNAHFLCITDDESDESDESDEPESEKKPKQPKTQNKQVKAEENASDDEDIDELLAGLDLDD